MAKKKKSENIHVAKQKRKGLVNELKKKKGRMWGA